MTVVLVEMVKTNNFDGFALCFSFFTSNLHPSTLESLSSNTQSDRPKTRMRSFYEN